MTLQQWLFSFKGRIGRRDFWIWIGLWIVAMALLFILVANGILDAQTGAFVLVCLLWPTSAVVVKRLHDRGKSGLWALLMIAAWMLLAGNWALLGGMWQWVVGRFIPTLILVMLLLDLGAFIGTPGENKYGKDTLDVKYR
ncbi:DUF805 domain-containing protein [Atlantibacter hermannii]|uniref:DUF805 domain-containing protein n=1 Tax=Atlantibacter hermannii TaxID=565 RepID=UPI001932B54D|nr:DUF805 domain-containing protein [Atlantibacter hermannii]MBL7636077.1 DUF805 domain-containing protein [Atlantibacter hermannii]MBL7672697.1 DUF805 domain-containing protein [Atlantibacter hermannii]